MTPEIIIISYLIIKHFIADFAYQPPYQLNNKGTYGHWGGVLHSGQHQILTLGLWFFIDVSFESLLFISIAEFIIHYHIDWGKMNINSKLRYTPVNKGFWVLIGLDQLAHYMTYVFILYALTM